MWLPRMLGRPQRSLSPCQAHDGPEGRALLSRLGPPDRPLHLCMDRAYEGNETRVMLVGFISFALIADGLRLC